MVQRMKPRSVDPTCRYSRHLRGDDRRSNHRLNDWNDLPPPRNPVKVARAEGRVHRNQATGTVLFPQSFMPCGPHAGMRTMERMPAAELLIHWAHRDKLRVWPEWRPVIDYIETNLAAIEAAAVR